MKIQIVHALAGLLLMIAINSGAAPPTVDPPPLGPVLRVKLNGWLRKNGKPPQEYIVRLFSDHDVVFLGEYHRIRHDVLLVQSLLEPLYQVGVRVLATEFGRREDQPLIDSVINAPEWNENLAREIVFRLGVYWGFREYVDIYKAVWKLNKNLSNDAPRFRILGINDSPDWSYIKSQADLSNMDIMMKVWQGCSEQYWAQVILDAVRAGEKVLVYSGIHHAFTAYRQPIVSDGRFLGFIGEPRCGNCVFNALGKRSITVFLHSPWYGRDGYESPLRHPADGIIDSLMITKGPYAVGFDLNGGPFGELRVKEAVYCNGYKDFKLSDFCDGWIYTKPISDYEGVTSIPGWINSGNLARAQDQSPNPDFRNASADEWNAAIAHDAENHESYGYLH